MRGGRRVGLPVRCMQIAKEGNCLGSAPAVAFITPLTSSGGSRRSWARGAALSLAQVIAKIHHTVLAMELFTLRDKCVYSTR